MALNFLPTNSKFDFVGYRFIFFFISIVITLGSFWFLFSGSLNYGVDFKGGFLMSVRSESHKIEDLRQMLLKMNLGEVSLQEIGTSKDIQIKIGRQPGDDKAQNIALEKIKETLGKDIEYRSIDTVGPKAGQDLINNAIWAVFFALLAMLGYVWVRFEWQFSLCSIIAIIHDCASIVGMYGLFHYEFNITAIMAILVTAGYSINDTIVIFDRIRENRVRYKKMPLGELINKSINETLSRTILTSATTLLALGALYIFGGDIIASYSLPMIVGIGVGTYSSIFLAAPLLLHLGFKTEK